MRTGDVVGKTLIVSARAERASSKSASQIASAKSLSASPAGKN
jgi:hypothetical protein